MDSLSPTPKVPFRIGREEESELLYIRTRISLFCNKFCYIFFAKGFVCNKNLFAELSVILLDYPIL